MPERHNLSARIKYDDVADYREIRELGEAFNSMADRIEEEIASKQRLIRDVAHELRSPLARLEVALELIRKTKGDSLERHLDRINKESGRMNHMISQLLNLSRAESTGTSAKEMADVNAIVVDVLESIKIEAERKSLTIHVKSGNNCIAPVLKDRMNSALENVLRNAVKYTPHGGSITIATCRNEEQLQIRVNDTGPGVPESELKKIFQVFYRVDESRQRDTGGTGVGLAIAYRTFELHGGKIWASNLPSGGLQVTATINC